MLHSLGNGPDLRCQEGASTLEMGVNAHAERTVLLGAIQRYWISWAGHRIVILVYHRIAERRDDPHDLIVTPGHFAEHLAVLRRWGSPVKLVDAPHLLRQRLPRCGYVVTFDDGYADNLLCAKPVLERFDTPATVFAASAFAPGDREFWWETMHELLSIAGERRIALHIGEKALEPGSADWLGLEMSRMTPSRIEEVLGDMRRQIGCADQGAANGRPMNANQLRELVQSGLVQVGAHTINHRRLALLTPEEQHGEIVGSKAQLEAVLGEPVDTFAYPFGFADTDFTDVTRKIVKEAGYTCACAVRPFPVVKSCDVYALPRCWVSDWDGDEFEQRLRHWYAR